MLEVETTRDPSQGATRGERYHFLGEKGRGRGKLEGSPEGYINLVRREKDCGKRGKEGSGVSLSVSPRSFAAKGGTRLLLGEKIKKK